jgi:hypothetical protein
VELPRDVTAHWSLMDYATALGGMFGAFGAGIFSGMGAYHVTCRKGELALTHGAMDWEAMRTQWDRIEENQRLLLEGRSAEISPPVPSRSKRRTPTITPPSGPEDPP